MSVQLGGPGRTPRFERNPNMPRKPILIVSKKKKAPTNKTLNNKIKRIQSKEELKHVDVLSSGTTLPSTGTFLLLNGVDQGDTDILREGNDITATSIQWRIRYITDVDLVQHVHIRMIVFWDQQPNGAAPTAATLLDTSVITSIINAPYNRNYQKRFKILHDSITTIVPQTIQTFTPATGATTQLVANGAYRHSKRNLSRTVKYSGAGATVAAIQTNSLYAFWVSNVAAEFPTMVAGFRFYFKDD